MCYSHRSIIFRARYTHERTKTKTKTILEEDTLKDGLFLLGEGDSMLLPSKALNESSFSDPFQYALL